MNAIAQDQDRFIWLGTSLGLVKYDGYEFKVYRRPCENLWVAVQGGGWLRASLGNALSYEREKDRFTPFLDNPDALSKDIVRVLLGRSTK